MNKYNGYKNLKPDYNFVIKGDIAKGTLPDGTTFLIDTDKIDVVSKYWFHLNWKGYIYTLKSKDKKCNLRLHWIVLGYVDPPNVIIDHNNRDKTDCRVSNLRIVTTQQNAMNRNIGRNNRSGYLGAFFSKSVGKYIGKICINGNQIILLRSDDIIECAQAYNYASELLFDKYAGHRNDVEEPSEQIKRIVENKCKPYMEQSAMATQPCGLFYYPKRLGMQDIG